MPRKRKYEKDRLAQGALATSHKWKKTYMEKIPKMFGEGMSLIEIAKDIGISTALIYRWKEESPELKRRLTEAKEAAIDDLEITLMKRAKGFNAPNGEYILPDVNALKFALGKLRRNKFGDEKTININHTNTEGLTVEEIEERIKSLENKNNVNLIDYKEDIVDGDFEELEDDEDEDYENE